MSVKKEASGRRSVEMLVEVPGTPEQVWHAIATGPGLTGWFVPTEVEERVGGKIHFHMGPGMESVGTVTGWEPPRRLGYEERDWMPNAPPVATEVFVETKDGGTCVVRMVHSLFASTDDWDGQLEGFESGWPSFFHILQIYLRDFAGQVCSQFRVMGSGSGTHELAWQQLTAALDLAAARPGERYAATAAGLPKLVGTVERVSAASTFRELQLLVEEPARGVVAFGAFTWGENVHVSISTYFYGEGAADTVRELEPQLKTWLQERFPSTGAPFTC